MFMEERQEKIAAQIQTQGRISISEITSQFGISEESARRDLRLLEQSGLCKRTHGGAILPIQRGFRLPEDRTYADMPIREDYREIAKAAASKISPNDAIYLPGGAFGHIMLEYLPRTYPYTITVNSVHMALALRSLENADVYVVGGHMRKSGSLVDSMATEQVRRMHFDCCFLTGVGLTFDYGLSNRTGETTAFQQAVLHNSQRRILLIPGEKVGSNGFLQVCPAETFHTIITDWNCPDDQKENLSNQGIEVITVARSENP